LPDGSGVRRESHAPFCERLAVQSRRSTHHDDDGDDDDAKADEMMRKMQKQGQDMLDRMKRK
jgi:hypothetical protein